MTGNRPKNGNINIKALEQVPATTRSKDKVEIDISGDRWVMCTCPTGQFG